jgi:hypothetical protein
MTPIVVTNSSPAGRVKRVKAPTPAAGASPFFEEVFTGGVKNNANGFTWYTPTQDNGTVTVSADRAYSGTHSLKIAYNTGTVDTYTNPEQGFGLGRNLGEIWIEFQLWVPSDYAHGTGGGNHNNKFIRLWNTSYTEDVIKTGMSTWPQSGFSTRSEFQTDRVVVAGPPVQIGPGDSPTANLPTSAYGVWTRVGQDYKRRTSGGADDSRVKLWLDGSLVLDRNGTGALYDSVNAGYARGYIFGSSNGFDTQVTLYADAFKFYDADPAW